MSLFNNTEIAFSNKTSAQLKKAYWMFKMIENPNLTAFSVKCLNFMVHNRFPLVNTIVKKTLFEQFCGGETREESSKVVEMLFKSNIGSIFDYSIEGKVDEVAFDQFCQEIKDIILFSKGKKSIPFVVFKPTAIGNIDIYELVGQNKTLSLQQQKEWERIKIRTNEICELCHEHSIKVMIDAEESWMQDAADDLITEMMMKYNQKEAIVWNTLQMYRTHRLEFLEKQLAHANTHNYYLGFKIVRGAYMEKERNRAAEKAYTSPIQTTKENTDKDYNLAVDFILKNLDKISLFMGTHNENSCNILMQKMENMQLQKNDSRICFGQLYGMSDNISFTLSNLGYNVTKYLPYGPVKDVVPYLTRRAMENTSVAGQTGRELGLLQSELKRRKAI